MMGCNHKWIYNGEFEIKVDEPEEKFTEVVMFGNSKPKLISKGFTYFPTRHQFHCERCCKILRQK